MINVQYSFSDLTNALLTLIRSLKPKDGDKRTLLDNCKINLLVYQLLNIHLAILNRPTDNFTLNTDTDFDADLLNKQIEALENEIKSGADAPQINENQYCACWLTQQYIRQALNNQELLKRAFYFPFLNTVMRNLAKHYQQIDAEKGTIIKVEIVGEAGGVWTIQKQQLGWLNIELIENNADATIYLDQQLAWLLFGGALNLNEIGQYYQIIGNKQLGNHFLNLRISSPPQMQ